MNAKRLLSAAAMIGLTTLALNAKPVLADGDVDVDLRGGVYMDSNAAALGGGLLMNLGSYSGWYFNPNLEMIFRDNNTDASLNADFHYDFSVNSPSISPYVGAGPAVFLNDGNNDFGLNVLGGVAGKRGEVRPFAQVKGIIASNNDELALMGGIRF